MTAQPKHLFVIIIDLDELLFREHNTIFHFRNIFFQKLPSLLDGSAYTHTSHDNHMTITHVSHD